MQIKDTIKSAGCFAHFQQKAAWHLCKTQMYLKFDNGRHSRPRLREGKLCLNMARIVALYSGLVKWINSGDRVMLLS